MFATTDNGGMLEVGRVRAATGCGSRLVVRSCELIQSHACPAFESSRSSSWARATGAEETGEKVGRCRQWLARAFREASMRCWQGPAPERVFLAKMLRGQPLKGRKVTAALTAGH